MSTFVIFVISLGVIAFSFFMKSREISNGRKVFLAGFFSKSDIWLLKLWAKIKYFWSHVNLRNTRLLFYWIIAKIKKLIIAVKRRFDHKQSHFFVKREHHSASKNKGSVSFFLKNVSDYKKSLREERGDDLN